MQWMGTLLLDHTWELSAAAERKSLLDSAPLLLSAGHDPSAVLGEAGQPMCT